MIYQINLKVSLFLLLSCSVFDIIAHAETSASFVGSSTCVSCHSKESTEWKGSFHQQAMAEANQQTVLGNFNNAKFNYNGIVSKFFKRGAEYFVNTDGPDGKLADFKIDYTFGVFPLQQYLVKFPDGKMQALSIAWDSRLLKDGGQRWFHLYQNEKVDYKDVLHWTKHGQNWNSMCAECHSTNLQKNYDSQTNTFHSTWSEISVGCESCHGPASSHLVWAGKKESERGASYKGFEFSLKNTPFIAKHDPKDGKTLPETDRVPAKEMQTCARCHSRRSVIAKDYVYGQALMATHFPSLLTSDLYHADGQIKDEVYEYGSYTQSKMHQSGVTCSNCHNPHTLKLKAPGNEVCGQCHISTKYDSQEHHFHKVGSAGAECKSCHMPEKKYMQIDSRFDHSIRIPSPARSAKIGAPDACTSCHEGKSADWADEQLRKHFGKAKPDFHDYGITLSEARLGSLTAAQGLIELLNDDSKTAIVRATAIREIAPYLDRQTVMVIASQLFDNNPEVRAAAIGSLEAIPPGVKVQLLAPLLEDTELGVRIEAARVLASIPKGSFPQERLKQLEKVNSEYLSSQLINGENPQSQVNIGIFYANRTLSVEAEKAYQFAIKLEPKFIPAYVNLSDLYRQTGRDKEGAKILEKAISQVPDSAEAHFAIGLLKIRQGEKLNAIKDLKAAVELQPDSLHFSYVYAVALIDLGNKQDAQKFIKESLKRFPSANNLRDLESGLKQTDATND